MEKFYGNSDFYLYDELKKTNKKVNDLRAGYAWLFVGLLVAGYLAGTEIKSLKKDIAGLRKTEKETATQEE